MRAFGADRVRVDENGRAILSSRYPKGWQPRIPARLRRQEHPGTAVMWEEEYYEVVEAHSMPVGVRYVLERWKDEHIFRVIDRYDEESEAQRIAAYQKAIAREKKRKSAILFGMVLGHLPEAVQEELGSELGVSATRLTAASTIPGYIALAFTMYFTASSIVDQKPSPIPGWFSALSMYLGADAILRFKIAWLNNRAIGSFLGWLGYLIFWCLAPNRRSLVGPFQDVKGTGLFEMERDEATKLRESYRVREPLFSLLPMEDQVLLHETWGFDYQEHASTLTWIILAFSALGIVSSIGSFRATATITALMSFVCAVYLTTEQIVRLFRFRSGPAGSVFGYLVRPLAMKFLKAPPAPPPLTVDS